MNDLTKYNFPGRLPHDREDYWEENLESPETGQEIFSHPPSDRQGGTDQPALSEIERGVYEAILEILNELDYETNKYR